MIVNRLLPRLSPLFLAQNILAVYRTIHSAYQKDHPDRIRSPVWPRPHIQSPRTIGHQPLTLHPSLVLPHRPRPVLRPHPNRRDGILAGYQDKDHQKLNHQEKGCNPLCIYRTESPVCTEF